MQLLFVDYSDTVRARVAVGLFENIATWNGFGRTLLPFACGVEASNDPFHGLSTRASLMSMAPLLGLVPKHFARAADRFEPADLDRNDVVIALDDSVRQAVLAQVDPDYASYYAEKVMLLSDFAAFTGNDLYRQGGLALLPAKMSRQLKPDVLQLLDVVSISRPNLVDAESKAQWNVMVKTIMLGCAGLVKYLIQEYHAADLQEYDPQD